MRKRLFERFLIFDSLFAEGGYEIKIFPSVQLIENCLYDEKNSSLRIEVSTVGQIICLKLLKTQTLSFNQLFSWFQNQFSDTPKEILKRDLELFLWSLNRNGIINFTIAKNTSSLGKMNFFVKRMKDGSRMRYDVQEKNIIFLLSKITQKILKEHLSGLSLIGGANIICFVFISACFQKMDNMSSFLFFPFFSYVILLMSIAIHETSHIVTYRWLSKSEEGYISFKRFSVCIIRGKLNKRSSIFVRLSGAGVVFSLGMILYFVSDILWIRITSFVFMFHLINFLPFFGDGHAIISDLFS